MEKKKPIKVKPAFYANCYYYLKKIANVYGYNLVIHGSLDRDLDLVAIPWKKELGNCDTMIMEFAMFLGGTIMDQYDEHDNLRMFGNMNHGRINYIINLNRRRDSEGEDLQYYLDISVTPVIKQN